MADNELSKTDEKMMLKAKAQSDYRTGQYTINDLCDLYGVAYTTMQKWVEGIEKGAIEKEVAVMLDNRNRENMIRALGKQEITDDFVAAKLKSLLTDPDPQMVRYGIMEYNKIKGNYKETKDGGKGGNKSLTIVNLPKRDDDPVEADNE